MSSQRRPRRPCAPAYPSEPPTLPSPPDGRHRPRIRRARRRAELIRAKGISAVELTTALLARIDRLDPTVNAFRIVLHEEALAEAATRDDEAHRGRERGALHGVPIAIKDELDVAGHVTTFGGAARIEPARADSEPVRRLRAAGAVSGGTAAVVAAGMTPAAMGGDAGGSHALGTVGPLTRSVLDSALVYDAIRGNVASDRYRAEDPYVSFRASRRHRTGAPKNRHLRAARRARSE